MYEILFRTMFPDTETAKIYGSAVGGRTKIKCSCGDVHVGCDDLNCIPNQMQNQPFSVATDGSNETDNMKLYLVTVRYIYLRNCFTWAIMWDFRN